MTRMEFHDKTKIMKRRVKVFTGIWIPVMIVGATILGIRWSDTRMGGKFLALSLAAVGVAMMFLSLRFLVFRWAQQLGMTCPGCGKFFVRSRTPERVLATGCCEHCGRSVFSDT